MKMEEHFALPMGATETKLHNASVYGDLPWWVATFHDKKQLAAAAHAINCHDDLVGALQKMVVEGQEVYVALAQMGWGAEDFRKAAENAVAILTKAKGE